ncbi:hypothetical protein LA03_11665 [Burkholderia gladioli]|nr:hypothetical protein LA03_11665 [Burkholderia gladioli]
MNLLDAFHVTLREFTSIGIFSTIQFFAKYFIELIEAIENCLTHLWLRASLEKYRADHAGQHTQRVVGELYTQFVPIASECLKWRQDGLRITGKCNHVFPIHHHVQGLHP